MESNGLIALTQSLITEAQRSPALLSDLAGLESYVAESYSGRSFIELLQNADDAGATRFLVQSHDGLVAVANDGRTFTPEDLESLCRSAASTKTRGNSIGYRGIGFKSVVGIASSVYLISGQYEIQFSRTLTRAALNASSEVPLIRIPHPIEAQNAERVRSIARPLLDSGFNTIFVFDPRTSASIESEFAGLDSSTLIFLNSIQELSLRTPENSSNKFVERKQAAEGDTSVQVSTDGSAEVWLLSDAKGVSIAVASDSGRDVPDRSKQDQFVVHAFLPTHERTGFRFKLNGDFSTDPSRTRVVDDPLSTDLISQAASLYLDLLNGALWSVREQSLKIDSLVPYEDLRNAKFSRPGFYTRFVEQIKRQAGARFADVVLRPSWMNGQDYARLSGGLADLRTIRPNFEQVTGLRELFLFLGAKEADSSMLLLVTQQRLVEKQGAVEIVASAVRDQTTRGLAPAQSSVKSKIWKSADKIVSLDDLKKSKASLDADFVENLTEKGASASSLRRLIAVLTDDLTASRLVPDSKKPVANQGRSASSVQRARVNATRWRSAEQQVAEVFEQQGWSVEDVSRQNLGYDIRATHPDKGLRLIEVKGVPRIGSEFSLTTNEEGVARKEGMNYYIAVVSSTQNGLEIGLIQDPTGSVVLERQCRQWSWICDSYECHVEFVPYS